MPRQDGVDATIDVLIDDDDADGAVGLLLDRCEKSFELVDSADGGNDEIDIESAPARHSRIFYPRAE